MEESASFVSKLLFRLRMGWKKNCKEVMIFKTKKVTSIADPEKMKYYSAGDCGNKSGTKVRLIAKIINLSQIINILWYDLQGKLNQIFTF